MANDSSFRVSTRNLNSALDNVNKSSERLSTGRRINRASDDPAGLAIAERLASDATVFKQASNNVDYGQSLIAIKDGALDQVSQIGTRMQELATQSANGTLSDEQRTSLKNEYDALAQEADRIVQSTEFNGEKVFSGSSTSIQVGVTSGAESQIAISGTDVSSLVSTLKSQDIGSQEGAKAALDNAKGFVSSLSAERGKLGAASSRLETAAENIKVATENLRSAESRIRDVDVADEVAKRVSSNIRTEAASASFAQSKLSAANVLKLLK